MRSTSAAAISRLLATNDYAQRRIATRVTPPAYGLGDTIYGTGVGQAAMNANTVFNFFRPDFLPSGEMAGLGLLGPEFQINTDTLISNSANSTFSKAIHFDTADACTGPGNSYAGGPGRGSARIARRTLRS